MSLFDVREYTTDPNLEDRFGIPPFSILDRRKAAAAAERIDVFEDGAA